MFANSTRVGSIGIRVDLDDNQNQPRMTFLFPIFVFVAFSLMCTSFTTLLIDVFHEECALLKNYCVIFAGVLLQFKSVFNFIARNR